MRVILTRTLTMDGKVRKVLGVDLRSRGRIMFDFWSCRGCVVTLGKLLTSLCPCHQTVQLLRPWGAKYCDERVCLFACPLAYLKNICANFMKFSVRVIRDDTGLRYVLPVLWMTSCFPIMGYMAHGVGNIDVGAVLKQVVKMSNVSPRGRHAV